MKTLFIALVLISTQAFADHKDGGCFDAGSVFPRMQGNVFLHQNVSRESTDMQSKDHFFMVYSTKPKDPMSFHTRTIVKYVGIKSFKDNFGNSESLPTYQECE